jgi:hypothetical protein
MAAADRRKAGGAPEEVLRRKDLQIQRVARSETMGNRGNIASDVVLVSEGE